MSTVVRHAISIQIEVDAPDDLEAEETLKRAILAVMPAGARVTMTNHATAPAVGARLEWGGREFEFRCGRRRFVACAQTPFGEAVIRSDRYEGRALCGWLNGEAVILGRHLDMREAFQRYVERRLAGLEPFEVATGPDA